MRIMQSYQYMTKSISQSINQSTPHPRGTFSSPPPSWKSSNIAPPPTKQLQSSFISICNHTLRAPQSVPTRFKAPAPVGSPSLTAPPLPIHPSSTASNPLRSTAALLALHAWLEEPMLSSTIRKTKRDMTDSGRARGASRTTQPS